MEQKKVLVIIENPIFLEGILTWMSRSNLGVPIQAPSAVEGIAFYESFQPDAVFLEENISDMPISFLVPALCQLKNGTPIWIVTKSGQLLDSTSLPDGAYGVVSPSLPGFLPNSLFQKLPVMSMPSSNDQDKTVGIWQDDAQSDSFYDGSILTGEQVSERKSLVSIGDLKIIGDVHGLTDCHVKGNLTIQGDCVDSHIRCDGDIHVEGGILGLTKGVFCSGTLTANHLDHALVVCGNHLFFKEYCSESIVNTVGRIIGTGVSSSISGGRIRVGQHISVGSLGDTNLNDTLIEMAPPLFHEKLAAKYLLMKYTSANDGDMPFKWDMFADISVESLYQGVTLRFGETEDFTIRTHKGGFRVFLDGKIQIEKRTRLSLG